MRKISVVIPSYNRAALLDETLDRVLAQTCPPNEVIVVDDGSTDQTRSVLASYGDKVRSIFIPNSGDLVARNTGLRAASGELVAFCDSDDLWTPDHLAAMHIFWAEAGGPTCAYADFREVRDQVWGSVSKFSAAPKGYWDSLMPISENAGVFVVPVIQHLLQFQPFFPSCLVVDRNRFLALGGWDEGVSRLVGCDFATALLVSEHPPIGVLRRPTVGIRKHAGNFSGDVQRMNLGDAAVLDYVLATRPSLAPYSSMIRRSIESRRLEAFDIAFARGDFVGLDAIVRQISSRPVSVKHRVKRQVARLPPLLRRPVWSVLTRLR